MRSDKAKGGSRTIVISDAHGYPQLARNALEHARYEAGVDRLVFAGDFADRGPDGRACLELIEEFQLVLDPYAGAEGEHDWDDHRKPRLLNEVGPLWFRPTPALPEGLLQGVTQVCGHSPFDGREHRALAEQGLHVVDPTLVLGTMHHHGITYRYAVIEGGQVRVEEGVVVEPSDPPSTIWP